MNMPHSDEMNWTRPRQDSFRPTRGRGTHKAMVIDTPIAIPRSRRSCIMIGGVPDYFPVSSFVRPGNRRTAPAVLHSALSIARIDENALVAILPSDHHDLNESLISPVPVVPASTSAAKCSSAVVLGARTTRK